jgi:exosome complex component CSL4
MKANDHWSSLTTYFIIIIIMNNGEVSYVLPGQRMGTEADAIAGNGTYVLNGSIYASVSGLFSLKNGTLSVTRPHHKRIASLGVLHLDDTVVCKVAKLTMSQVMLEIFCVNDVVLKEAFAGTLRKEDVRPTDIDKLVLEEVFHPGDIVKAVVISMGDARSYFLSTSKPGLGVVQVQPHGS